VILGEQLSRFEAAHRKVVEDVRELGYLGLV
jgi:hypothetical protein